MSLPRELPQGHPSDYDAACTFRGFRRGIRPEAKIRNQKGIPGTGCRDGPACAVPGPPARGACLPSSGDRQARAGTADRPACAQRAGKRCYQSPIRADFIAAPLCGVAMKSPERAPYRALRSGTGRVEAVSPYPPCNPFLAPPLRGPSRRGLSLFPPSFFTLLLPSSSTIPPGFPSAASWPMGSPLSGHLGPTKMPVEGYSRSASSSVRIPPCSTSSTSSKC